MAPTTPFISRIALIYRIWFLYIEPVAALGGTYLSIFEPNRLLAGIMPLPAYLAASIASPTGPAVPITPILRMMLINIGALYALFAIIEGVVLRLTKENSVWYAVLAAMLVSDVGHIYAAYEIAPERILQLVSWNSDEWVNYGTLVFGAVLRSAFLLGLGRP
ncbi:hypothetical protein N431DRAFT_428733 [Stipitochalara longipes BDJ]|nr:hypothetical protein N431DRAFT_428733 [Stipitochalara longipes BDJ]